MEPPQTPSSDDSAGTSGLASNEGSSSEGGREEVLSPPGEAREILPNQNPLGRPLELPPGRSPINQSERSEETETEPEPAQVHEELPIHVAELDVGDYDYDSSHSSSRGTDNTEEDVNLLGVSTRRTTRLNALDERRVGGPREPGNPEEEEDETTSESEENEADQFGGPERRIRPIDPPVGPAPEQPYPDIQQPQPLFPHQLQAQENQFHDDHQAQGSSDSCDGEVAHYTRNYINPLGGTRDNLKPKPMEVAPCETQSSSGTNLHKKLMKSNLKRTLNKAGHPKAPDDEPPTKLPAKGSSSSSAESFYVVSEESLPPQTPGEAPSNSSPAMPGTGGDVQEGVMPRRQPEQEEPEDLMVQLAGNDRGVAIYEIPQARIQQGQIAQDEARQVGQRVVEGGEVFIRQQQNAPGEGQGERARLAHDPEHRGGELPEAIPEQAWVFPEGHNEEAEEEAQESDEEEANDEVALNQGEGQNEQDGAVPQGEGQLVEQPVAGEHQNMIEQVGGGFQNEEQEAHHVEQGQNEQQVQQPQGVQNEDQEQGQQQLQDEVEQYVIDETQENQLEQNERKNKKRIIEKKYSGGRYALEQDLVIENLPDGSARRVQGVEEENNFQRTRNDEEEVEGEGEEEVEEEEEAEEEEKVIDDHPRRNFDDDDWSGMGGQSILIVAPNSTPANDSSETSPVKTMHNHVDVLKLRSSLEMVAQKRSDSKSELDKNIDSENEVSEALEKMSSLIIESINCEDEENLRKKENKEGNASSLGKVREIMSRLKISDRDYDCQCLEHCACQRRFSPNCTHSR